MKTPVSGLTAVGPVLHLPVRVRSHAYTSGAGSTVTVAAAVRTTLTARHRIRRIATLLHCDLFGNPPDRGLEMSVVLVPAAAPPPIPLPDCERLCS